jgi:hypothetical protein
MSLYSAYSHFWLGIGLWPSKRLASLATVRFLAMVKYQQNELIFSLLAPLARYRVVA